MMFSLSVSASAANTTVRTEDVKISVDGKTVDVPKGSIWISEDGYTMVGARALAEGVGAEIKWDSATRTAVIKGMTKQVGMYSPVAAYENMVGAAVWQMSAECHGLMMQAFNIGKRNVDEMVAKAKAGTDGFKMENGKLFKDGKRVEQRRLRPLRHERGLHRPARRRGVREVLRGQRHRVLLCHQPL